MKLFLNNFGENELAEMVQLITPLLVLFMAVRWLRLRQTQASWALLFCLSVFLPPSGERGKFLVGWSIRTLSTSSKDYISFFRKRTLKSSIFWYSLFLVQEKIGTLCCIRTSFTRSFKQILIQERLNFPRYFFITKSIIVFNILLRLEQNMKKTDLLIGTVLAR